MGFWDLSDGDSAANDAKTEYEVPGGNLEPIPNNSDVLAEISQAKWAKTKDDDARFLEIQWKVQQPEAVKNRVVFQKLWVDDLDPQAKTEEKAIQKRDKARKMLATIDANAGGKLAQKAEAPDDDALALALSGKQMVIKCMVWEMPDRERYGEFIRGNWISAVKPKDAALHVSNEAPKPKSQAPSGGGGSTVSGGAFDDEIPFAPEWRV